MSTVTGEIGRKSNRFPFLGILILLLIALFAILMPVSTPKTTPPNWRGCQGDDYYQLGADETIKREMIGQNQIRVQLLKNGFPKPVAELNLYRIPQPTDIASLMQFNGMPTTGYVWTEYVQNWGASRQYISTRLLVEGDRYLFDLGDTNPRLFNNSIEGFGRFINECLTNSITTGNGDYIYYPGQ